MNFNVEYIESEIIDHYLQDNTFILDVPFRSGFPFQSFFHTHNPF